MTAAAAHAQNDSITVAKCISENLKSEAADVTPATLSKFAKRIFHERLSCNEDNLSKENLIALIDTVREEMKRELKDIPNADLKFLLQDYVRIILSEQGYLHGSDDKDKLTTMDEVIGDYRKKVMEPRSSVLVNAIGNIPHTRWASILHDEYNANLYDSREEYDTSMKVIGDAWKKWAIDGMLLQELRDRLDDGRWK